jgi:hypothetical protein
MGLGVAEKPTGYEIARKYPACQTFFHAAVFAQVLVGSLSSLSEFFAEDFIGEFLQTAAEGEVKVVEGSKILENKNRIAICACQF